MKKKVILLMIVFTAFRMYAQETVTNYDEAKVPPYTLPDPLQLNNKRILSAAEWTQVQRPQVLQLFKQHVYGKFPGKPAGLHFRTRSTDSSAYDGKVIRKQVTLFFTAGEKGPSMELLLYLPKKARYPVGVFTGLNFCGNHCISSDTGIFLSRSWMPSGKGTAVINNRATEAARGGSASRWPVEQIIEHGYGLATAYYGDLEPDHVDGWKTGVRSTLQHQLKISPENWSAIGAWAWGLSRIMDYLESDPAVNPKKVAVTGHSRLGKAALWAAANDVRFGLVISNNSGEGGAALARRWYGETVAVINKQFPHWFVDKFKSYNARPDALPVDQHMLLALMAPRPVYVASAENDQWADPKGEFLSLQHAEPVFKLFGKKGLGVETMPPVNQPVGEDLRYHIRTGDHDITGYDWQQYLDFADKQWADK